MRKITIVMYLFVSLFSGIGWGWSSLAAVAAPVGTPSAPAFSTGVCIYDDASAPDDRKAITQLLDRRAARHDTSVCIVVPFTQARWDASAVEPLPDVTPSSDQLRFVIREAHERGLTVMLKPLLDEANIAKTGPAGAWRGTIKPADATAWFASYGDLLSEYVKLGREEGLSWLVIGSEFSSLETPAYEPLWTDLIGRLKHEIGDSSVELTYAQNWDMAPNAPSWFAALDAISIDAYFPLYGVDAGASVEELQRAFDRYTGVIETVKARFPDKPLFFTEVGIVSQANMFSAPWTWGSQAAGPPDLDAQRRYFAAACSFYGQVGDGLYWWVVNLDPPADPSADNGFSFIGKPAEAVVDQCSAQHQNDASEE